MIITARLENMAILAAIDCGRAVMWLVQYRQSSEAIIGTGGPVYLIEK